MDEVCRWPWSSTAPIAHDMKLAEATLDQHHDRAPDAHRGAPTAFVLGCWL